MANLSIDTNMEKQTGKKMVGFGFKGIEIVEYSLKPYEKQEFNPNDFQFKIDLNQKVDLTNKFIHVLVSVLVSTRDTQTEAASLTTLSVFNVDSFDNFKKDGDNIVLPQDFIDQLNTIAISTTRGVMFTVFRGTHLHTLILPIVYPNQFQRKE